MASTLWNFCTGIPQLIPQGPLQQQVSQERKSCCYKIAHIYTVDLGCNEVKGSEFKFRYNQGFVTDKVLYNMYN